MNEDISSIVPTIFEGTPKSQATSDDIAGDNDSKAPEQEIEPAAGGTTGMSVRRGILQG